MVTSWDKSLETGDPAIDQQHRQVIALVDELETAEAELHLSRDEISGLLDRVMEFTIAHFATEEDLMRSVEYPSPAAQQMVDQHREFTAYGRLRALEFRTGVVVSTLPLKSFLREWLVVHEFGLDRRLADYIRERGKKSSK